MAFFQTKQQEATAEAEKEYATMWLGYFVAMVESYPDLVFIGMHPYLADGDPSGLRQTLSELMEWPVDIVVPGHGEVGGKEDIQTMIDYVDMTGSIKVL